MRVVIENMVWDEPRGALSLDGMVDDDVESIWIVADGAARQLFAAEHWHKDLGPEDAPYRPFCFHAELPLDALPKSVQFRERADGPAQPLRFVGHNAGLNSRYGALYHRFADGTAISYHPAKCRLVIGRIGPLQVLGRELRIAKKLLGKGHLPLALRARLLGLRALYWLTRPYFSRQRIWLYYDKLYKGGDNGEYLFRQAAKRADGITHCYVIDHSTRYYRRLRRDGYRHLLRPNSLWLRLHTLNAEQFCVTHRNKLRYLGFKVHGRQFFANLVRAKTVATSHGLVIDHVPKSAGQQRDNAVLHFCASPRERDALLLPDYGFAAANVKLLGIPRFDGLRDEQRDFVLLAPTWRVGVLPPMAEGDDRYLDTFPETAYFQTFNALIHHPALLDGLARRGRRLKFLLHPVFAANKPHFQPPPGVDVIRGDTEADYVELMSRAAVMVTDYSGIQYDFAYLRKPLVYYHPPELPHHYKPSQVFSYDEDAFGPVLTNPDDVVAEALAAVDRGEPTAERRARMNAFFAFDDRGNAERIYQALIASSQPAGRRS